MFSTAMSRNPSATSSAVRVRPVPVETCAASAANLSRTTSASSGASPRGPKTLGKSDG